MRVLIVKTSSLGDIIHALPVIDYLRQAQTGIEIDWVVEEQFLPLVEHNPHLSRVHVIRTKRWRKAPFSRQTMGEIREFISGLRERPYDLVFDIQGNLKSGLITRLSRTGDRIGPSIEFLQEKLNALFTDRKIPYRPCDRLASERYLRIVSVPFGRDYPGMELDGTIHSAPEDEEAADRYMAELPDGLVFLFQVGTTWQTKLWHAEGWRQLAERLLAAYPDASILINWGSAEEKQLGEQIAAQVRGNVRLLPWLTVRQLIPFIRRVDTVIGGDTGPVYLAAAVGTPTVSFYRATSAATYAPKGESHRSVQAAMDCAGCGRTTCERDEACRETITAEALFSAVAEIVQD